VYSAKFILGGDQALLTGNRRHFYSYDLEANKLERCTCPSISEKNLALVAVSPETDMMCVANKDSGIAHILS